MERSGAGRPETEARKVQLPAGAGVQLTPSRRCLPRMPAGKPIPEFMAELEAVVEERSEALLVEAGFKA